MELAAAALGFAATAGTMATGIASLAAYARRRYRLERSPDERLRVATDDGWTLAMLHYRPRRRAFREPVILCHGLSANSFNLDLDERHSLARHLAARGFDAFVPDLRGRAGSWPDEGGRRARHAYDFDHHAFFDAPALVRAALEATGEKRLFWLGHSMGGMVGAIEAAREPERIAGLVTLGSPARLSLERAMGRLVRLALALPFDPLPQRFFAQALAPLVRGRFPPLPELTALRSNLEPETMRHALANVVVDLPRRLLRQLAEWALFEKPLSRHGGVDYREHLASLRVPLLVVAGNRDRLAPPIDVRPTFDLAKSRDRSLLVLGSASGPLTGHDFGHVDLVLGRDAPALVFPLLSAWLESRATRLAQRPSERLAVGLAEGLR